ncbi:hypothetical protein Dimus_014698 [Dionaea muscipula]
MATNKSSISIPSFLHLANNTRKRIALPHLGQLEATRKGEENLLQDTIPSHLNLLRVFQMNHMTTLGMACHRPLNCFTTGNPNHHETKPLIELGRTPSKPVNIGSTRPTHNDNG